MPHTNHQAASNLSLKQLHYLVMLAHTLNFTRAAQACFVTQSTLSAGIQELESALGVQLVERSNKRVLLTAIGQDTVARAQTLLALGGDLMAAAKHSADPLNATISLGAIPTIAPFMLPSLLRTLRQQAPTLRVLLREEQTEHLLHAVDTGELDAALIALPMDTGRLHVWPLFEEELWLITSTAESLAAKAAPTLKGLDLHRLMLLGEGHCLREHTLAACPTTRRGKATQPSDIEATSLTTLIQMVEAGLGVSMLPAMAVRAGLLNASEVVARPFASPAPKRVVALVSRPTQANSSALAQVKALAIALGKPSMGGAKRSRTKPASAAIPTPPTPTTTISAPSTPST
jgi:LysR family transcriptional regulator, hydrogen peroxide-inducible genes activator